MYDNHTDRCAKRNYAQRICAFFRRLSAAAVLIKAYSLPLAESPSRQGKYE